jgi:transposase
MSLKQTAITEIPEDTARVAKAVFKKGHRYLLLRDTFGDLFSTDDLRVLFHIEGRPAIDPARLALITVIQFAENLSDERMADAVRSRIDLKYLLALPLDWSGFDASVLSEFRTRLIQGQAESVLFERLLERFRSHGLLKARGLQRTDATHVFAAIHALNRVSVVGETFRHTLNVLAIAAPTWLAEHGKPEWIRRYGERFNLTSAVPTSSQAQRDVLLAEIAADGLFLLERLSSSLQPAWLWELPAVGVLHQVWLQNFTWAEDGILRYRSGEELPPSGQYRRIQVASAQRDPEGLRFLCQRRKACPTTVSRSHYGISSKPL